MSDQLRLVDDLDPVLLLLVDRLPDEELDDDLLSGERDLDRSPRDEALLDEPLRCERRPFELLEARLLLLDLLEELSAFLLLFAEASFSIRLLLFRSSEALIVVFASRRFLDSVSAEVDSVLSFLLEVVAFSFRFLLLRTDRTSRADGSTWFRLKMAIATDADVTDSSKSVTLEIASVSFSEQVIDFARTRTSSMQCLCSSSRKLKT